MSAGLLAAAGELDSVGIGACAAAAGAPLNGHFRGFGGCSESGDDSRIHVWTAIDARAPAELDVPFLRFVDRRAVGGVRHVDGDADVRIDAVRARDRAAQ